MEGRPDVFKAGFGTELRDFARVIMNGENSNCVAAVLIRMNSIRHSQITAG